MSANRIKIVKDDINKYVNIPINMQWDFMGRDDSIDEYEVKAIKEVTGIAADFEVARFSNKPYLNMDSAINYEFNFYDDTAPITANTIGNWTSSYINEGFSVQEVYYYSKPFTKSFFKLDFYDTPEESTQQIYLSIILPVQQGLKETVILNPTQPPIEIKKPTMILDSIGADKEGFYIYWLRHRDFIDISKFYMTAKFFNGRLGVFKQMTNTRQDLITPNKFQFNNADYFYYIVELDYSNKTYEVFSTSTQNRVGDSLSPIKWYEYVNP
jgi:hypothetical protein